jgi:uncharacterized membrane protein
LRKRLPKARGHLARPGVAATSGTILGSAPRAKRRRNDMTAPAEKPSAAVRERRNGSPVPRTVDELTAQNVALIHRLEAAAFTDRGRFELLADGVARFAGNAVFLLVHVAWFAAWIAVNTWPSLRHFDPYPFTFLTLIVSLEAIFLSAFILISQKRAAEISDRRNQLDLQINLLTEQENTRVLKVLGAIAKKLGVDVTDDPSAEVLEQSTRPDKLVEQIVKAQEPKAPKGGGEEAEEKPPTQR